MISPYFYYECCNEIMFKLIYLTKCSIDLTVYPSLKIATSVEIQRRVAIKAVKHTCLSQANTK